MGWGLCPPPARGDARSQQVLACPSPSPRAAHGASWGDSLPLSQGSSQSLLGDSLTSFYQDSCGASCLGPRGRLVPLERIQPPVTRAAFLGPTHTCSSTPRSDQRGPLGPRAPGSVWALTPLRPGPSLSRPLQGHQELPLPGAGCLPCPGEALVVSGLRNSRFLWGLPHTAQRPAPAYRPLPVDGPGGPMGESLSYSVPASQRGCSFAHPSQELRVLGGRLLPGYGAQVPHRAQHPGTVYRDLVAEHPQSTCWSGLTPSPSEQDLN